MGIISSTEDKKANQVTENGNMEMEENNGNINRPPAINQHPGETDLNVNNGGGAEAEAGAQPSGVILYQMTIRHAIANGQRVTGGVRVLLDHPNRQGYVQLISLLNEVYVTHYVTSMNFLSPSSAAGVAWCAIPWLGSNCGNCGCTRVNNPGGGGGASVLDPGTRVETIEVVFCDPNHAQRFKVVLDTIRTAFSSSPEATIPFKASANPCLGGQGGGGGGASFNNNQNMTQQGGGGFQTVYPGGPDRPVFAPGDPQTSQQRPHMARRPQDFPINNNHGGFQARQMTQRQQQASPFIGNANQSNGPPQFPDPYLQQGAVPPGVYCPTQPSVEPGAPAPPQFPNQYSGVPAPPMARHPAHSDPYAFSHTRAAQPAIYSGLDPYAFAQDRILFSAPACLVRLEKKTQWKEMFRGVAKVLQRASGVGFSMLLESAEGTICCHHFITADMTFEPSSTTQFGYTFSAVSRGMRCGVRPCGGTGSLVDDFLISFQGRPQYDHFKHVVCEVQRCLAAVAPAGGYDPLANDNGFVSVGALTTTGLENNMCYSNNNSSSNGSNSGGGFPVFPAAGIDNNYNFNNSCYIGGEGGGGESRCLMEYTGSDQLLYDSETWLSTNYGEDLHVDATGYFYTWADGGCFSSYSRCT